MEALEEVTDMLSQPMLGSQFDEDDLLAEFEQELEEDLETELLDTGVGGVELPDAPLDLPDAPQAVPQAPAQAQGDEAELAELAAWMN
jgi:hypothetical protein